MASAVSVLAPTGSHSQSLPPQEILQYFSAGLWTCCGQSVASSDSDLALLQHVLASKVHSLSCGNTHCPFRYFTDAGFTKPTVDLIGCS